MKFGSYVRRMKKADTGSFRLRLLFVVLFFLLGIFLGWFYAKGAIGKTSEEIAYYLETYLKLDAAAAKSSLPAVLFAYFRYPVLVFLLGFASAGVLLLPLVSIAQGFFLSFAVCCFSSALGRSGILAVLAMFGIRCLFTLTCSFWLAAESFSTAWALAQLSFRRVGRTMPVAFNGEHFLRFGVCVLLLLIGSALELAVVPGLLLWLTA